MDLRLFGVLKRVQHRSRLRKVRLAENLSVGRHHGLWKNRLWNWALRCFPPTAVTTSGFTTFATFLEAAGQGRLPYASLEVMVHPGHPNFSKESSLLKEPWRQTLSFAVQLISYCDL